MSELTRREILKASAASAALLAGGTLRAHAEDEDATPATRTLRRLLRHSQKEEYRHGYNTRVNHAPMCLIALYRMGATPAQLEAYDRRLKRPRFSIAARQQKVTLGRATWRSRLGQTDALHPYVHYFRGQVEKHGRADTLRAHAHDLLFGAGAAAFHPLIKLGYALDIDDDEEVALALAYWASQFERVPAATQVGAALPLHELVATLVRDKAIGALPRSRGNIVARMRVVFRSEAFRRALRPIAVDEKRPLDAIAVTVRDAFVSKHHFTILHAMTSTHALRLLLPYVEKPKAPLSAFGHALAAAYLTAVNMGSQDLDHPLPEATPKRAALESVGAAARNDHVIKVSHTCLCEAEAYKDPTYLRIAARDQGSPARYS